MGTLVRIFMSLVAPLPLGFHYFIGRLFSWWMEKVVHYRRHTITVNLARSFPELHYDELEELVHKFYIHFGEVVAEGVWFGGCRNPERLRRKRIVEIENPEDLYSLYENSGSVMALMTHTGNWELIGGLGNYDYTGGNFRLTQDDVVVVYMRQSTKMWNSFLRENRTAPLIDRKNFRGYVESSEIMRFVLEHRERKMMYNFITDQFPYSPSKGNIELEFMHQQCLSMKGAAEIARKLGMAVCYVSMPQAGHGHYKLRYETICTDASNMSAEDIMKEYYRRLEEDLRAQPWNYLWSHRRWKAN